jgi:hypothetical protein
VLGRLDARLHADQVAHVALQLRVHRNEEIDGGGRALREARARILDPVGEPTRGRMYYIVILLQHYIYIYRRIIRDRIAVI